MITHSNIELIKHIVNNNRQFLNEIAHHFKKTPTFIRNEIANINLHIPIKHHIAIKNSIVTTSMEYPDFLKLVQNIDLMSYIPTLTERLNVILVLGYFQSYINLTSLYEKWGISLTTKKSDIKSLESFLKPYSLDVKRKPGSGIQIIGNLLNYRILIIQIISKCIDVNDYNIEYRGANTPYERMIYQTLMSNNIDIIYRAQFMVNSFLEEYGNDLNYYSKKFFLLYVVLALFTQDKTEVKVQKLTLEPLNLFLLPDRNENIAFNQVASMIDFNPVMPFPHNQILFNLVDELFEFVQKRIVTFIHTKQALVDELYTFIYRQYFVQHFNYSYEDKLVKKTSERYP